MNNTIEQLRILCDKLEGTERTLIEGTMKLGDSPYWTQVVSGLMDAYVLGQRAACSWIMGDIQQKLNQAEDE